MKRYSIYKLACLFGVSAIVFACNPDPVIPALPADHYVLTRGTLFSTAAGIDVIADTINISICPPEAFCFAPDNVSASIRLIQNSETRSVRLFSWFGEYTRRDSPAIGLTDSTSVRFGSQLYKVILKARYITTGKDKTGQAILQVAKL